MPDGIPACARGRRGRIGVPQPGQHTWRRALAEGEVATQAGGASDTAFWLRPHPAPRSLGKVRAKREVCLPLGLGPVG